MLEQLKLLHIFINSGFENKNSLVKYERLILKKVKVIKNKLTTTISYSLTMKGIIECD